MKETHLVGDLLDQQLVDRHGVKMGKLDGLVIEWRPHSSDAEQPRVVFIDTGAVVMAGRLGRRFERIAFWLSRRIGIRRRPRYRIPWSRVRRIGIDVELDLDAKTTPAFAWERWLRQHIIERLPFAR